MRFGVLSKLVIFCILIAVIRCASLYSFDLNKDSMTSSTQFNNNGGNINFQDPNSYVEIKQIIAGTNIRGKGGLIQIDQSNKVTFDKLISTTGTYFMGGVFYAYETTYSSSLFCILTKLTACPNVHSN